MRQSFWKALMYPVLFSSLGMVVGVVSCESFRVL